MFKRKRFSFLLTVLLLIGALITIGTGKTQEMPDFIIIDVYDPLTGETGSVEMHPEEAGQYLAAQKKPYSSLENAVAVMGQPLRFETEMQLVSFVNNEMIKMSKLVKLESDLLYPEGPVISKGVTKEGYFIVALLEGFEYDKSVIDRVYAAYEDQFLREGLRDAPVIFRYEEFPKLERNKNHRPVFGGLQVTNWSYSTSTLAYGAVRQGISGYVVSAHANLDVGLTMYQPNLWPWNTAGSVGK